MPTLDIVGFCEDDEKLFGPVQLYVVPVELAVKLNVDPVQSGLLLPATGAAGGGEITTGVVAIGPIHPPTDANTV